eukprot:gene10464-12225_t
MIVVACSSLSVLLALISLCFARSFANNSGSSALVAVSSPCSLQIAEIGDFNHDGHSDFLVGCSLSHSYHVLVVFAVNGALPPLDISSFVSGSAGFRLLGIESALPLDNIACAAGDVNNDGYGDFLITVPFSNNPASTTATTVYVILGHGSDFQDIDLTSFTSGQAGFKVLGVTKPSDLPSATSATAAGDVNGDGFADILVHVIQENTSKLLVIFGRRYLHADIDLDTFSTGEKGLVVLYPTAATSAPAISSTSDKASNLLMASVGDINKDGFEDFVVGSTARSSDNTFTLFVILGHASFHTSIDLSQPLASMTGFKIFGDASSFDHADPAPYEDVHQAGTTRQSAGVLTVIYGKHTPFVDLDLRALPSSAGYRVFGPSSGAHFGSAIKRRGDVNGDGLNDLRVTTTESAGP